jgi:hypothetical protein
LATAQALQPTATDNCTTSTGIAYTQTTGALVGNTYTNSWVARDACGNNSVPFIQVINVTSVTIDASASSAPVPVGSPITLKATVTPAEAGITVSFYIDGATTPTCSVLTDASGLATCSIPGGLPTEVYKVKAIVGSGCAESIAYLAVYDPNGGFVTGGGWFNSLAGAYIPNPTLTGKANFGFVSKYKKGSTVPEGNTEFQFHAGNLNFTSTSYNSGSLVVATFKAIYKGVGKINGAGNYGFMVSAVDGQISGGGGADKFRIKIWDKDDLDKVVYDNQFGADENLPANTVLGGGSIVIHEAKANNNLIATGPTNTSNLVTDESKPFKVNVYPNPTSSNFKIEVESDSDELINIRVYDILGHVVTNLTKVTRNSVVATGDKLKGGTYFAEITQGKNRKLVKLIKLN